MTKTYQQLLAESPEYLVCAHGSTGKVALGFRGPHDIIEKAWYLFLNFDRNCVLHWIGNDLAYISTSPERIKSAIKLFLYVNILHSGEAKSTEHWDEDSGTFELIQDIERATQLAEEDSNHFMASLKVQSFIPSSESTPAFEYNNPFTNGG